MADKTEPTKASKTRIVAEWVGTARLPAMRGTARRLTQAEVSESLVMDVTRDLLWSEGHAFRVDVSDESPEFIAWLGNQEEFKVTGN